jgi:hypothetical protein
MAMSRNWRSSNLITACALGILEFYSIWKAIRLLSIVWSIAVRRTDRTKNMTALHPQVIERNGKKEFAVIPYDEFLKLQEYLEDLEDLKLLREAQAVERKAPVMTLAEVKRKLEKGKSGKRSTSQS